MEPQILLHAIRRHVFSIYVCFRFSHFAVCWKELKIDSKFPLIQILYYTCNFKDLIKELHVDSVIFLNIWKENIAVKVSLKNANVQISAIEQRDLKSFASGLHGKAESNATSRKTSIILSASQSLKVTPSSGSHPTAFSPQILVSSCPSLFIPHENSEGWEPWLSANISLFSEGK